MGVDLGLAVAIFVLGLVYDAVFVLWSRYSSKRAIPQAVLASMFLVGISLISIRFAINNWLCALADILGCGLGTYLVLKYGTHE